MYRMKMRLIVDVEIVTSDSEKAFKLLENAKYNIQRAALLPSCNIKRVATDAMLSEETFEDPALISKFYKETDKACEETWASRREEK